MKSNSETIDTLNDLIRINHDRVAGYQVVIDEMREASNPITATLFEKYKQDSEENIAELSKFVNELGGTPSDSSSISGTLHRFWIEVKNTFSTHEKEAALESCIFGDEAAIKTYQSVLNDTEDPVSGRIQNVLTQQLASIQLAHGANAAYEKSLEYTR